jgi:YD repeat-containing protein
MSERSMCQRSVSEQSINKDEVEDEMVVSDRVITQTLKFGTQVIATLDENKYLLSEAYINGDEVEQIVSYYYVFSDTGSIASQRSETYNCAHMERQADTLRFYDDQGRLVKETATTEDGSEITAYDYDKLGDQTSTSSFASGSEESETYDENGDIETKAETYPDGLTQTSFFKDGEKYKVVVEYGDGMRKTSYFDQ